LRKKLVAGPNSSTNLAVQVGTEKNEPSYTDGLCKSGGNTAPFNVGKAQGEVQDFVLCLFLAIGQD
jgi:hypothetical protein